VQLQHLPILLLKQTLGTTGKNNNDQVTYMAVATQQNALKSAPATGLTSMIEAVRTRFVRHRVYRQTVNELSSLTNRELADLGLHRSMIRRLAMQAAEEYVAH
jgi:uncharacterized protein YjiS (DUF1127 family)